MEQLIQRLNNIPGTYYEFVDSVVEYANLKEKHFAILQDFLENHPSATPSDVIKFISFQPDFFDDSVPSDITNYAG